MGISLGSANVEIKASTQGFDPGEYYFIRVEVEDNGSLLCVLPEAVNGLKTVHLMPGDWRIEDRYSPITEDEVAFQLGDTEFEVVVESAESNPNGTTYVRFVVLDHEALYWVVDEWEEDGENVMGAIFGAMFGRLQGQPLRLPNSTK